MARILIDGSMARGGGGLTYLVNMVPCLSRLAPNDRFLVIVRSDRIASSLPAAPNLATELLPPAGPVGRLWFLLLQGARIASRWGADLYFSAGETVPLVTRCPRIASFRNANSFRPIDPEYPAGERFRLRTLRALAKFSARTCERILFVSADSARWIGKAIGIPEARRAVVHHGVDVGAWRPGGSCGPMHPRPYILSVSSIYRYKNFVRLIEAYARLAQRNPLVALPDLVIIGDDQDPPYRRQMEAARASTADLAAHIHIVGEVPYGDISRWYAGAELFVFPSYLETFGHPLLEAMAAGVPLVAADTPVAREIAGAAALYADPFRVDSLAAAMGQGLLEPATRAALVARGTERVRCFTWERAAASLLALFSEVLSEPQREGPREIPRERVLRAPSSGS
jgi:glycosyltransferase involved in cell wall biosynthesis